MNWRSSVHEGEDPGNPSRCMQRDTEQGQQPIGGSRDCSVEGGEGAEKVSEAVMASLPIQCLTFSKVRLV